MKSVLAGINNTRFAGKPEDEESGLAYFGARYYDPILGRFMGLDPVAPNPENIHSFNRYAYANNSPYKYVDPDGRLPIFIPIAAALLFEGGNLALESASDASNPCGDCVRSSGVLIPSGPVAVAGYKLGKALSQPVVRAEEAVVSRVDYSIIKNPSNVGSGKDLTLRQKQEALELNKTANGGVVKSDASGVILVKPQKSQCGVTPNPNEWQFDHIIPKSCGGTNCSSNLQILSRQENRAKSNK